MFGFFSRLAASQASIMRDSADSAVLGMVGGRYSLEKCEVGECFQIGNSGVVGNSGVAHPQRDGVGGQKGTDTILMQDSMP
jgi:hypothetical protein